jgi:hypothetical protein
MREYLLKTVKTREQWMNDMRREKFFFSLSRNEKKRENASSLFSKEKKKTKCCQIDKSVNFY